MRLRIRRYTKWKFSRADEGKIVPVVGDAVIAVPGVGHGRPFPLLVLDTTERPDIAEIIRVQNQLPEGDVEVTWMQQRGQLGHVALMLHFLRPVERTAIVSFDIFERGAIVEHILFARATYIQSGKPGDRLIHNLGVPKMSIEVPDTGFQAYWDKLFLDGVQRRMIANGYGRRDARTAATLHIRSVRRLVHVINGE